MDATRPIPGPPLAPGRFAIRAARLYDGTGGPARRDPLVIVDDGWIVAVEDARRVGDPGCPIVDAGDATLLPGLVDAHTHLWWQGPDDAQDTGRSRAMVERHAARTLAGGVTTARDLGGPLEALLAVRGAIASGDAAGPRLRIAGPPLTVAGGHCHWFGRQVGSAADARAVVEELAARGVDAIKLLLTGGMSTPMSDPFAPRIPLPTARAAVDAAHRHGLPVAAHALGTPGVRLALAAGVDSVEHGWTITGREQGFEPDVVEGLRRGGVVASVTAHHALRELLPGAQVAPDGPGDVAELRRRLTPHRVVAAAGVPIVVHGDAGPGPTAHDGFGECLMVFALGMRTTVAAAVHAGTLAPARALGLGEVLGSVRAGRVADLVVLDGDPGADLAAFRRVRDVVQGGRHVAHRGRPIGGVDAAQPPPGTGSGPCLGTSSPA